MSDLARKMAERSWREQTVWPQDSRSARLVRTFADYISVSVGISHPTDGPCTYCALRGALTAFPVEAS